MKQRSEILKCYFILFVDYYYMKRLTKENDRVGTGGFGRVGRITGARAYSYNCILHILYFRVPLVVQEMKRFRFIVKLVKRTGRADDFDQFVSYRSDSCIGVRTGRVGRCCACVEIRRGY